MSEKVVLQKFRSTIGVNKHALKILKSLGFPEKSHVGRKVSQTINAPTQGKINLVSHLIRVLEKN